MLCWETARLSDGPNRMRVVFDANVLLRDA